MEEFYTESYRVRAHEVSTDKCINLPSLIRIMQEASLQHAIQLGASIWDTRMQNRSWVLIKKEVKIEYYPLLNTIIHVKTYPSHFDKFFAYRDWICTDEQGKTIATGISQWTLIDGETRKMAKVPEHLFDIQLAKTNLGKPTFKGTFIQSNHKAYSRIIDRYDLDWNNHLNNSSLIKYMLASLPESIDQKSIKTFKVVFKSEAKLGDVISTSFYEENGNIKIASKNSDTNKILAISEIG